MKRVYRFRVDGNEMFLTMKQARDYVIATKKVARLSMRLRRKAK